VVTSATVGSADKLCLPLLSPLLCSRSIANMFLIPLGMALGADISVGTFLLRNVLSVTLGNTVAGALCMGLASAFFYSPHNAVVAVTHTHLKPV
jgi:hypothetical protein